MKKSKPKKLKLYPTEKVAVLKFKKSKKGERYAITNHGRAIRFLTKPRAGEFMKLLTASAGYPSIQLRHIRKGSTLLIHRLVALAFLPKPKHNQIFVIHKDRVIDNNHVSNLAWANKAEHVAHAMGSKAWKLAFENNHGRGKLTADRVRLLRTKLATGKTTMKTLAKQFGISEMQVYRIKSGENWAWLK